MFVISHGRTHAVTPALPWCIGGSFFHEFSPNTKYSTVLGSTHGSRVFDIPPKTTIVSPIITAAQRVYKYKLRLSNQDFYVMGVESHCIKIGEFNTESLVTLIILMVTRFFKV